MTLQLLIAFVFGSGINPAIQDTIPEIQTEVPADTVLTINGVQDEEIEPPGRPEDQPYILPMKQRIPINFREAFTDSLLRWEQFYTLAERQISQPGAIGYRLGAHGRHDGVMMRATEPRHRRIFFDGIPFNDPVSGALNTNLLPLDRMRTYAEQTSGITHDGWFELDRFYVTEPLTWVNLQNTRHDVRSAEGIITANADRQTNIELAYRGNNDGGEYRRNVLSGRQASIRLSRYLNQNWLVQGMLFYNSFQMDEPEGFVVTDPILFPFERNFVTPNSQNSNSSLRNSLVSASVYYRPDLREPAMFKAHVYQNRFRRLFNSTQDSTFHRSFTNGVHASGNLSVGSFMLQPHVNVMFTTTDEEQTRSLEIESWNTYNAGFHASISPVDFITLNSWGDFSMRSDDQTGFQAGYQTDIRIGRSIKVYQSLSFGRLIPTIQQMYWLSNNYAGNPEILPEQIARIEAGLEWGRGWLSGIGMRVYGSDISNPILNDRATGEFINIDNYQSAGAEVYLNIDTQYFEVAASTTFQTYMSMSANPVNVELDDSGFRIWNRLSAFYKNYFFDFATYAKIGASVVFSPTVYHTSRYIPVLDYWDPMSEEIEIPSFYRVDLMASARVRNVMFLMKYENLFDEIGQNGYFETAGYPMPSRRFRLGIRWILRN